MDLKELAKNIRADTVRSIASVGVGHIGGALSIADVLAVLYGKHMNIDPKNPQKEGRDRLILSKGHAGPALYAALANLGYFEKDLLLTLNKNGTDLPSHCNMQKTPGIDFSTGSLGQGLSCACGVAYGSKLKNDGATVYCVIGDGESQEGQIWEAAMFAAQAKLDNLIVFTDNNHAQIDGMTDDVCSLLNLEHKWEAFGFRVFVADGHDIDQIDKAITEAKQKDGRPVMILLDTVKGKGVGFIEKETFKCHSMSISEEQAKAAIEEILK